MMRLDREDRVVDQYEDVDDLNDLAMASSNDLMGNSLANYFSQLFEVKHNHSQHKRKSNQSIIPGKQVPNFMTRCFRNYVSLF